MGVMSVARAIAALALSAGLVAHLGGASFAAGASDARAVFAVSPQEIDDLKSVYATVRSKDLIQARVRTPGTIASLKVDEGDSVEPGQVLALVGDPKIALRIKALDARIVADESRLETAKTELERARTLQERGFASQARLDQAQTAYDVAVNELKSAQADRSVIETEIAEGQVLAPTSGRVLKVPVTEGSVVLAGESIATIAANEYLLRLELPERHARFIKVGDKVRLGARGLGPDEAPLAEGRISQVYPELQDGHIVADAEVPDLGSYFVGERVLVWISAGKRQTFVVPRDLVFKRFGIDYVRLKKDDGSVADVVVQTGHDVKEAGAPVKVEILAGVAAGDKLVQP
jgi:RND family efflux transporter MFP subunit